MTEIKAGKALFWSDRESDSAYISKILPRLFAIMSFRQEKKVHQSFISPTYLFKLISTTSFQDTVK